MRVLVTGGSGFIGTNLVQYFLDKGCHVKSIDLQPPKIDTHRPFWVQLDICDFAAFKKVVESFAPDYILHMAARTNLTGKTMDDYKANTVAIENLIAISNSISNVKKVIFASSMLVCKVGYLPINDDDYCTTTVYGRSKVKGEEIVKNAETNFSWVIVRPTSIWGPWFGSTYRGFFELIKKRLYFNFSGKMSTKTYGYIGNVVYQIDILMTTELANGKVFYLGDYEPTYIKDWAHEIANEFGCKVHTVPRWVVYIAAKFGDVLKHFGFSFPMNSFRFKNMTTDNTFDLTEMKMIAPETKFSRKIGNRLTIEWLNNMVN